MKVMRRVIATCILLLFTILVVLRIANYATHDRSPGEPAMPAAVDWREERDLFLTPRGKYTAADIAANGNDWPSHKYRGFRPQHDFRPQPGDRICPITRTKSNPACTWVVNGERYEFCCPPCIAEFVLLAKDSPERIQPSQKYLKATSD